MYIYLWADMCQLPNNAFVLHVISIFPKTVAEQEEGCRKRNYSQKYEL